MHSEPFLNFELQYLQSLLNSQEWIHSEKVSKQNLFPSSLIEEYMRNVLKDMKIKKFVYKNSLAIGMILMIISILYLHLNK